MSPSVASPEEYRKWIFLGVAPGRSLAICLVGYKFMRQCTVTPGNKSHNFSREGDLGSRGRAHFFRYHLGENDYYQDVVVFELIKAVMEINSLRCYVWTMTDIGFFLWNRHGRRT